MKWTKVEDKLPELFLINSTTSMSKYYPVYTEKGSIEIGYLTKYLEDEKARWTVGCLERPLVVTHWIETDGPN